MCLTPVNITGLLLPCRPLLVFSAVVDCGLVALEMNTHRLSLGEASIQWLFSDHRKLIPDHWASAENVQRKITFIKEPFHMVGRPVQPLLGRSLAT